MKTLLLMRHAKSDWSQPELSDHDRPLKPRGVRAARKMAERWPAALPDLVLCSTAVRAQNTWQEIKAFWESQQHPRPTVSIIPELYHCDPAEFPRQLARQSKVETCLIIGHNPALEDWIFRLTGAAATLPTAALARLEVEGANWSATGRTPGSVWLTNVWRPRELAE